jgi:hypothetical protein
VLPIVKEAVVQKTMGALLSFGPLLKSFVSDPHRLGKWNILRNYSWILGYTLFESIPSSSSQ